ncbi:flavoprotein [Kitasatospora sp. NPDC059827]|uniref:flavoprotein n=1 Tax=Kitasatospora sp. NPDC059827 TaxID=3346964 RepID=UPI00364D3845
MDDESPPEQLDPFRYTPFTPRRLLLVGTGALGVSFLPFWVKWLATVHPDVQVRVALTRSARRFVSEEALAVLSRRAVIRDEWDDQHGVEALHVTIAEWAEAVAVYPATAHFTARFALGLADTPVLLGLQATDAVIGIAPSYPPHAHRSPVLQRHVQTLRALPRVVVQPTIPAVSATTGALDDGSAGYLSQMLSLMEERHSLLARSQRSAP